VVVGNLVLDALDHLWRAYDPLFPTPGLRLITALPFITVDGLVDHILGGFQVPQFLHDVPWAVSGLVPLHNEVVDLRHLQLQLLFNLIGFPCPSSRYM